MKYKVLMEVFSGDTSKFNHKYNIISISLKILSNKYTLLRVTSHNYGQS